MKEIQPVDQVDHLPVREAIRYWERRKEKRCATLNCLGAWNGLLSDLQYTSLKLPQVRAVRYKIQRGQTARCCCLKDL